jgi:hypothetical protein
MRNEDCPVEVFLTVALHEVSVEKDFDCMFGICEGSRMGYIFLSRLRSTCKDGHGTNEQYGRHNGQYVFIQGHEGRGLYPSFS